MTNRPPDAVRCRAHASPVCEHGDVIKDWREDGTYLEADDSIVCTPCYIVIGTPNNPVLPTATAGPRAADDPADTRLRLLRIDIDNSVSEIRKPVDAWREVVAALHCDYMDVVRLIPGELAMYVDDTGRITNRPINLAASVLYAEHCKATVPIHGPVIFFRPMGDGTDAELGRVGQVAVQAATVAVELAKGAARADRN